jgi:hypothetical protein
MSRDAAERLGATLASVRHVAVLFAQQAARQGRTAQATLLGAVVSAAYVFATPPTALWRALSGVDFLLGVLALFAWAAAAATAQSGAPPLAAAPADTHALKERARGARDAVRLATLADALANIVAPWVALACGYKAEARFCAPNFFFVALQLAGRFGAHALFPDGARYVTPPATLALDGARFASLLARTAPLPGGVLTALQLAALATFCYSACVAHLGGEAAEYLEAMRAKKTGSAKKPTTTPSPSRAQKAQQRVEEPKTPAAVTSATTPPHDEAREAAKRAADAAVHRAAASLEKEEAKPSPMKVDSPAAPSSPSRETVLRTPAVVTPPKE